jgi:hypothetical protein
MFCFWIYNVQADGAEVTPHIRAHLIIQARRVLVLRARRVLVLPVSSHEQMKL